MNTGINCTVFNASRNVLLFCIAQCVITSLIFFSTGCSSNIHSFLSELPSGYPASFDDGPVCTNPFGAAVNTYSVFFNYRGMIYIGPSPDAASFVRFSPDGTNKETVLFTINGDGATTAAMNPGPDSETGIDCFTTGSIGGTEYLFLGPAKSGGDLNYLYYTTDSSANLNFYYMDVSGALTATTSGTESLFVYYNKLYAGYAATSTRPLFLKISTIASVPSLTNLQATSMPRIGDGGTNPNTATRVGIDMMREYNGLLFIANGGGAALNSDGGIVSSTNTDPGNYNGQPTDWDTTLTPTGVAPWQNGGTRYSIELTTMNNITPSQKAFPAQGVFNSVLYIARNTTDGPQIWAYNGSAFSLVADNGSGISNMGQSSNTRITMLTVNGDRLYIGFDNATEGIQIYRTVPGVTAPAAQSDFEQVSSSGLGYGAANEKIFHAISVPDGGLDYVWVLCGKSGGTMYVFRTSN
ncbi:MAG TPA: hypothetical protein PLT75_10845 [Spirochaetota bacterium]|nr:hypothetical protein [Spirochaetota bacterium]